MLDIIPAIIVEGKYDKIKLKSIVNGNIVETNGFSIFNDKNKQIYIRNLANKDGIIVFTDSDGAGFVIRNFIKNLCGGARIFHAYIPDIYGKERRKDKASAEGKLGVEGMPAQLIVEILTNACQMYNDTNTVASKDTEQLLSTADFYDFGLIGSSNSKDMRKYICKSLELPEHISNLALIEAVNAISSREMIEKLVEEWKEKNSFALED